GPGRRRRRHRQKRIVDIDRRGGGGTPCVVFLIDETKQEVVLPIGWKEQTMAERQRVLVPFGRIAPLGQIEPPGVLVREIVATEPVGRSDRLKRVRPRLDPRKNAVVIVGSRHIRDDGTGQRLRTDYGASAEYVS